MSTLELALAAVLLLIAAPAGLLLAAALTMVAAGRLSLLYHWRNLFVRRTMTVLTLLVIATVVGTFTWLIGFHSALNSSLEMASDDRKIVVLQRGSLSESNSALPPDDFNRLSQTPGVAVDAISGAAEISPEMLVMVSLPRTRDQGATYANVAVRGVTDAAFRVHRNIVRPPRSFSTGSPEVIVGLAAAKQFRGLEIGQKVRLGFSNNREYEVVGHFSAGGGPMESEIWGYLPSLQSAYGRTVYSSAALRLAEGASAADAVAAIEGPAIQLAGLTEADYWKNQSTNVKTYQAFCLILVVMMTLAAIFAIANTMFAAVAGRSREIAMLRTIGYPRRRILLGFVLESAILAALGGLLGVAGAGVYLAAAGNTKDMFGASTFTSLAFEIRLTLPLAAAAIGVFMVVGVLGAGFPAWRAARANVLTALREP